MKKCRAGYVVIPVSVVIHLVKRSTTVAVLRFVTNTWNKFNNNRIFLLLLCMCSYHQHIIGEHWNWDVRQERKCVSPCYDIAQLSLSTHIVWNNITKCISPRREITSDTRNVVCVIVSTKTLRWDSILDNIAVWMCRLCWPSIRWTQFVAYVLCQLQVNLLRHRTRSNGHRAYITERGSLIIICRL